MTIFRLTGLIALFGAAVVGTARAQNGLEQPSSIHPVTFAYGSYFAEENKEAASANKQVDPVAEPGACGCGTTCDSCGGGGCDSCCNKGCGCGHDWALFKHGDCCDLGDPWTLWGHLYPCDDACCNVGGWFQVGYTDEGNGLFNDHPNEINVHQAWGWLEKAADGSDCCWDWGYRADVVYGVDAQDTQAFGNTQDAAGNPRGYDNDWDHGVYGWALPQLYVEAAYGDLNIKAGHFFTIIGYEVIPAPDNFFFSHAYTRYNSEPFTHTGMLATYGVSEGVDLYGGWVAGWDTGFDQFGDGSSFLGGFSFPICCDLSFIYTTVAGDFGARGADGYMHSIVLAYTINDCWEYVLQSDVLRVDATGEDTFGLNNYLFYTVNDCLKFGGRMEWWQADDLTGFTYGGRIPAVAAGTHSYYEATFGLNYKPNANLILRPEVRQDWAPFANYDETIIGVDVIALW